MTVVLGDVGELVAEDVDCKDVDWDWDWVRVIAAGTAVVLAVVWAVVLAVVLAGVVVDVVLSAFPFAFPFPFPFPFLFPLFPLSDEKGSAPKVDTHHWMNLVTLEKYSDQFPKLILFLSLALGRSLESHDYEHRRSDKVIKGHPPRFHVPQEKATG